MGFPEVILAAILRRAAHIESDRRPDLFLTIELNREAANDVCQAVIKQHANTILLAQCRQKDVKRVFKNNLSLTHHRAGRRE
jgi:hypothetical protein